MPGQTRNKNKKPVRGRFAQSNREALITLGLYAAYFIWWYCFAYGLGGGDPADYTYVLGFPAWFFYSCVVGGPLFSVLVWLTVRFFFREMPLDPRFAADADETAENRERGEESREAVPARTNEDFS